MKLLKKTYHSVIFIILGIVLLPFSALGLSDYGYTKATDSLWYIAQLLRPNKTVSMQQTMLALLRNNHHAFICDNVNSLKPGHILHLPATNKIKSVSKAQALAIVARQNREWRASPDKACSTHSWKKIKSTHHVQIKKRMVMKPAMKITVTPLPPPPEPMAVVVSKDLQNFKQVTDNRLVVLTSQNNSLQNQVTKVTADVGHVKQEIKQVHQNQLALQKQPYFNRLIQDLGGIGITGIVGFLIILLLILLKVICCLKGSCKIASRAAAEEKNNLVTKTDADLEGSDYDFLGSKEGIPAKLDLARMYADMGDSVKAAEALQEVLANGDADQKKTAQDLLVKITQNNQH